MLFPHIGILCVFLAVLPHTEWLETLEQVYITKAHHNMATLAAVQSLPP